MNLDFSEEQERLRDTVHSLCVEYSDSAALRRLEGSEKGYSEDFWQQLAELGLCGLLIDEHHNGVALGQLECAIMHEEMGRFLAPSPHFGSCILAARLLKRAGSSAQKDQWLPEIGNGTALLLPAWQEQNVTADAAQLQLQAQREGDSFLLNGEKVLVPFANSADALIVLFRYEGELQALLLSTEQLELRAQPNHAQQNLYAVKFNDILVPSNALLAANSIAQAWDETMLEGLIALAAQAIGGSQRMQEMAIEYAKQRQQFGQPIGAFQSIAHALADRATEIEGVRYLVYQAAWACDQGEPFGQLALMAKLQATAVFRRCTETGVQIHGGMGFSLDADPQLYYRRAKHQQLTHWDSRYLEQRIAAGVFA